MTPHSDGIAGAATKTRSDETSGGNRKRLRRI
jgi:hypothetical protein